MERMPMTNGRTTVCVAFCVLIGCIGCLNSGQKDSGLASYEAARRQIERRPQSDVEHVSYDEPDADDGIGLASLSPDNLASSLKEFAGQGKDPESAKQAYATANELFRAAAEARRSPTTDHAAQFALAAEAYREAADLWPNSTLEHDALRNLGESYFFADAYPKAEEAFEELLKKYPNSKHLDRVQPRRYRIAQYWLELDEADPQGFHEVNLTDPSRPRRDTFGHAVRVLDRVRLDDPTGDMADDATLALGNAFFRRGKYLRADEYYTDLRQTFPSSEHQFQAHFLGLKSKLLSYQGHDYSANALFEAEKLVKQIRRQFPAEAAQEREFVDRADREVRFKKAEREWVLAEHHNNRAEYGAARFYYQAILDEYGDTPFAPRSRQRLQAIGGQPATPPQPLSWLVDLFPSTDEVTPLLATDPSQSQLR